MDRVSILGRIFSFYWPTSDTEAENAEKKLLSRIQTPYKQSFVKIADGEFINTVEMLPEDTGKPTKHHVVMLHGFAAGLALWHANLDNMAAIPGAKVYAIDWLGMGRSSRPTYKIKPTQEDSVEQAEAFFADSLERWREAMKLERMTLVGHSLGGYFSAAYALRYPHRVERLVLVSPAGVERKPEDHWIDGPLPFWTRMILWGWSRNITPQDALRVAGPYGPNLVRKYTTRRFAKFDQQLVDDITSYGYHINVRSASSESSLNNVLAVGAFGKKPLVDRLSALKMPVLFLYGNHDWMDAEAGEEVVQQLNDGKDKPVADIQVIQHAGHHLYMDNPHDFRIAMEKFFATKFRTNRDRASIDEIQ